MKFEDAHDYVQMRDGGSFVGAVTQDRLQVQLGFSAKPMAIETSQLLHIVFANKYGYSSDELNFKDGSSLQGKVLDAEIAFASDTLGELKIPTQRILAIQFLGNL